MLVNLPCPQVDEAGHRTATGRNQQVQSTVAIQVREHRTRAGLSRTCRAARQRDIRELPVAEISIEGIGAIEIAEVQVTPAVPVEISRRQARAVQEVVVNFRPGQGKCVGEEDALGLVGEQAEASLARGGNHHRGDTVIRLLRPIEGRRTVGNTDPYKISTSGVKFEAAHS